MFGNDPNKNRMREGFIMQIFLNRIKPNKQKKLLVIANCYALKGNDFYARP